MLEEKTRQVLKTLTSINKKMIFTYPRMVVKKGNHIQAFLDLDKIGEAEFKEFGMYDFSDFTNSIAMDKKPIITSEDIGNGKQVLKITDSVTNGITKYVTSDMEMLEAGDCRGKLDLPDRLLNPERNTKVLEFEITRDQFDIIRKKARHFKMTEMIIKANEEGITLGVKGVQKSTNDYNITFEGDVIENIELTLDIDLVDLLPLGAYKIIIVKSQKGTPMPMFISTTIDGLVISMARKVV